MDWIVIVEATPDNRVAKYRDFATEAEAQAHVDTVIDNYPNAFAHPKPAGALKHWLVDVVAKTVIVSPDSADLDKQVRQAIIAEGTRRIESFVMGSLLEVGIVLYLCIKKATGRAWVQVEKNQAEKSFTKFQYVAQVYQTAVDAINTIDTLTEQEKLNFNASTDVTWPNQP